MKYFLAGENLEKIEKLIYAPAEKAGGVDEITSE